MTDFLNFRKMITPIVIQVLFWIAVALSVIIGIAMIISGIGIAAAGNGMMNSGGGGGGAIGGVTILLGILQIIIGPFLARIWCELIILAFRIYETLVEIRDGSAPSAAAPAGYYQPQPVLP